MEPRRRTVYMTGHWAAATAVGVERLPNVYCRKNEGNLIPVEDVTFKIRNLKKKRTSYCLAKRSSTIPYKIFYLVVFCAARHM